MAGVGQSGSGGAGVKSQSGAGVGIGYTIKCTTGDRPPPANLPGTGFVPKSWTDNAIGVDNLMKYEWAVFRSKTGTVWSAFSSPVLWAKFDRK